MKYFTGSLWKDSNSDDRIIREQAQTEWKKRDALYTERYQKEKVLFPDDFIELLEKTHGFHDFKIRRITMNMEEWPKRFCAVELSDGEKVFELFFQKVSAFMVSCPSLHPGFYNELRWGYMEIGHKGRQLTLSVLCDFENEFTIHFKTVSINTRTIRAVMSTGDGSV